MEKLEKVRIALAAAVRIAAPRSIAVNLNDYWWFFRNVEGLVPANFLKAVLKVDFE